MLDQDRLQELINALAEVGSANDPIWLDGGNGHETTPSELPELKEYTSLYKKFWFYPLKGKSRYADGHGTLIQMLLDRGGNPCHKPEPEEPEVCSVCRRPFDNH